MSAPRDQDRIRKRQPARRMYFVEPEVLAMVHGQPLAVDLDYDEQYRQELAIAHSAIFLLEDDALTRSVLERRPLGTFRDPLKVQKARQANNGLDPVTTQLNPLLIQLGIPTF